MKYGYMCKTDYDYHVGEDIDGVTIYPDLLSLFMNRSCIEDCGWVKVELNVVETKPEKPWSQRR